MDYRLRIIVTVYPSVIILFVVSILTESQETIPECHGYKVEQIRSDHLTSSWGSYVHTQIDIPCHFYTPYKNSCT